MTLRTGSQAHGARDSKFSIWATESLDQRTGMTIVFLFKKTNARCKGAKYEEAGEEAGKIVSWGGRSWGWYMRKSDHKV